MHVWVRRHANIYIYRYISCLYCIILYYIYSYIYTATATYARDDNTITHLKTMSSWACVPASAPARLMSVPEDG